MFTHFYQGRWVPLEQILIPGIDLAVTRSFAMFEYLRTYQQHPFHLRTHVDRLFRTGDILRLAPPFTRDEIIGIVGEGVERNRREADELEVKIVVTGGESLDGITPQEGRQRFFVQFGAVRPHDVEPYRRGAKLITRPQSRIFTGAKSSVYLGALVHRELARSHGAVEMLNVSHDGRVSECMRANVFFCTDREVITPVDDLLPGITRDVLLRLLRGAGIPLVEREVFVDELAAMQGAWITGSGIEVLPIVAIDGDILGNGSVHPLARTAMELFAGYTSHYDGGARD